MAEEKLDKNWTNYKPGQFPNFDQKTGLSREKNWTMVALTILYNNRPKVFEKQQFVFIHSMFRQHNNICGSFNMVVFIKQYVKYKKISKNRI